MTPQEKAIAAINTRLEQLQAKLREAKLETAQQFLFQSLVVTIGVGEALNDYLKGIGEHARRRHAELKQTNEALGAQHAELLTSGREMLEKLKADPTDRAIRKEIERTQRDMAAVQKNLRRGANALQRELGPLLATIDQMAVSVGRFSAAEQTDALKRVIRTIIGQARELYATQPGLPAKDLIDAATWEKSAGAEIDQAGGFQDGYARAGYQVALALELMTLALATNPPATAEEATQRASESLAVRLKEITARFGPA